MSSWKRLGKALGGWLLTIFLPVLLATILSFNVGYRRGSEAMKVAIFEAWNLMVNTRSEK